jgi:hypothetical protein
MNVGYALRPAREASNRRQCERFAQRANKKRNRDRPWCSATIGPVRSPDSKLCSSDSAESVSDKEWQPARAIIERHDVFAVKCDECYIIVLKHVGNPGCLPIWDAPESEYRLSTLEVISVSK